MSTSQKVENIRPLVERMRQDVVWLRRPNDKFPVRVDAEVTQARLERHVSTGPYLGLSFIFPGESTCRAAALDMDSHGGETDWPTMVAEARKVCDLLLLEGHYPVAFRSSGGRGIHIYLIWDEPQDAHSVRHMLTSILREAGYSVGTKGVANHEIEIFPKQDQVRPGGFGNMVILPLANKSTALHPETLEDLAPDDPVEWRVSGPVPYVEHVVRDFSPRAVSLELEDLRRALSAIPQEDDPLDYDEWRNVIFAIHYATDGSDDGLALAHEFSARSYKYDPEFLDNRVWPYIHSDGGITDRYITYLASRYGYVACQASDFDGLGPTPAAQPTKAERKNRFTPVPAWQFASDMPAVHWLIKGVIPAAELVMVYGASGSGKTFAVLDMAMAIARGVEWRGCKVHQGRVVYVVAEGAHGFRRRLMAYAIANGIKLKDIDMLVIGGNPPSLMQKNDVIDLINSIKESGGARLVVLDTLAKVTAGANENSGEDMGLALSHAQLIHEVLGCTVLIVHHSGKDETRGSRGWSGIKGALDAEIEVIRADHDRAITVTKQKDGEEGLSYGFRLREVPIGILDEDGEDITSCVCEATDLIAKTVRDRKLDARAAKVRETIVSLPADENGTVDPEDVVEKLKGVHQANAVRRAIADLVRAGLVQEVNGRLRDSSYQSLAN